MDSPNIISDSADKTRSIGVKLGKLAMEGDVILLVGALGVGKTCLTQGIARGLGIDDYVLSPSFVIVREYSGRLPLYHMDLYRLDMVEEIANLGLDEYLYGCGVSVIEWADKGLTVLPAGHLLIEMRYINPSLRELRFVPNGSRYKEMLYQLQNKWLLTTK